MGFDFFFEETCGYVIWIQKRHIPEFSEGRQEANDNRFKKFPGKTSINCYYAIDLL